MEELFARTCDSLSLHGWIALALGAAGVTVLHLGLMWLARRRYDPDAAGATGATGAGAPQGPMGPQRPD